MDLTPTEVAAYVTWSVLATGAVGLAVLWLRPGFRPLDEPLLDLLLIVGAGSAAALAGVLVRLGADAARLPSAATSAVFVALVTAAMAVPAALWARRALLTRRYGSGLLSPADVAVITADLHAQTDPRDLLERAARMVAAASGSPEARIVLGPMLPRFPDVGRCTPSSSAVTGLERWPSTPATRRDRRRASGTSLPSCCPPLPWWPGRSAWRSRPSTPGGTCPANATPSASGSWATCTTGWVPFSRA